MNNKSFTVDVMIEIPKGGKNKYEYDEETKLIRLDRSLYSAVHYPSDYGFVMNTLALDHDSLDALVLVQEPTFPGCVIEAKPIGVFNMTDKKGRDEKILCVANNDPMYNHYEDISDIAPHLLKEIEHFFSIYKDLEMETTQIEGWGDKKGAIEVIYESQERYKNRDS